MKVLRHLPQKCPVGGCSLRDLTVPRRYRVSPDKKSRRIRRQFTAAVVIKIDQSGEGRTYWQCPTCQGEWSQVGVAP